MYGGGEEGLMDSRQNEIYAAERDESRSARYAMTEADYGTRHRSAANGHIVIGDADDDAYGGGS